MKVNHSNKEKGEQLFTIGEIHKLGLLKTREGEPYKSKIPIATLVNKADYHEVPNKHGLGKGLTLLQIEEINARFS